VQDHGAEEHYQPTQGVPAQYSPNSDRSKVLVVPIYTVYYDTSRMQDDPAGMIVTAGLAFTAPRWESFNAQWRLALDKCGLPYLHMADFVSGNGPFDLLKGKYKERAWRIDLLADVVHHNVEMAFVTGVDLAAYRAVDAEYEVSEVYGGPYAFCADGCREQAASFLAGAPRHAGSRHVAHVFEQGDAGQTDLRKLLRQDRIPVSFVSKTDALISEVSPHFQAADFVAWEYRRAVEAIGNKKQLRDMAMKIHDLIPAETRFSYEDALRWLCAEVPFHRRST
jgi:hypothetical protein